MLRQEFAHRDADQRGAAKTAADDDFPAGVALVVLVQAQADIVHLDRGAVIAARRSRRS